MKNIQFVLTLLLTISCIFGLRIAEFPTYYQKYINLLYVLFFWSVYYFFFQYTLISYVHVQSFIPYSICLYVDIFTMLLSIIFGIYYNKKFRDCLKKLSIVDNTLEKLGMTIDYFKVYIKTILLLLSWIIITILLTCIEILWSQNEFNYNITTAMYIVYIVNYSSHFKFISNLIFTSLLECIILKFDQINELLCNLAKDEHERTAIFESFRLHSNYCRFSETINNELIYILMHIHLELCKICREIDLIYGVEVTVFIGCYFCWLAHCFYEILNLLLISNYIKDKILYSALIFSWCFYFIFKLLLINYTCERLSMKANVTGDLIHKIIYFNSNIDHKNISQFLLQITQAPLKFYGLRLFPLGYKVFHNFSKYAVTILVIIAQMHIDK